MQGGLELFRDYVSARDVASGEWRGLIDPIAVDGAACFSRAGDHLPALFLMLGGFFGPSEGWPSPVDGSCLENSRGDEPPGVRIPLPPPDFEFKSASSADVLPATGAPLTAKLTAYGVDSGG